MQWSGPNNIQPQQTLVQRGTTTVAFDEQYFENIGVHRRIIGRFYQIYSVKRTAHNVIKPCTVSLYSVFCLYVGQYKNLYVR